MEEDSMDITMSTENCSMLDSSVLDSSVLSTNTVTSSRRRIKKGSAVVLNKNKLKYIEKVEEAIYTITTATLSSADQADDSYGGSHSHSHSNSHSYSHNNSDNQSGLGQGISVRSAANSESSTIYRDNYSADSSSHSSPEVLKQSSLLIHKRQIPQQQLHFQESHNRSVDPHASAEECQAISRIVAWWGKYKLRIKLFRFRQSYKWSIVTSHKVLAAFLGYRVRYIMSSNMVKQLVLSQKDIYHVITDMFGINTSAVYSVKTFKKVKKNSNGSVNSDVVEPMRLETIIHAVRTNNYSKIRFMEPMSATDQTLAFSLVKQYLMEKDQLHEILFSTAAWLPFPGYWDLSITVAEAIQSNKNFKNNRRSSVTSTNKTTNSTSNVTKKNPLGELDTQQVVEAAPLRGSLLRSPVPARQRTAWETPPHCKDDVEVDNNENSGFYQSNGKDDRRMPKPLKEILAAKSTNQSSEVAASQSSTVYDSQSFSHTGPISTARSIRTFSSPPTILPKHQESVAPALPSVRKRSGPRGHVQLDVLSADKLMPAKKGGVPRDDNGLVVADRKPCFKVTFLLVPWPGGKSNADQDSSPGSAIEKKIMHVVKDFEAMTYNPQWGSTVVLNLPCPKNIVQAIASQPNYFLQREKFGELDSAESVTKGEYNYILKELLNWWSMGKILIEVYDGERFNQDIFLGQVQLLLSGFMVLIRKPEDLEIKGDYQLNKRKANDRISGTIKIHAYLHVPEYEYIAEIVNSISKTNQSDLSNYHDDSDNNNEEFDFQSPSVNNKLAELENRIKLFGTTASARASPPVSDNKDDVSTDFAELRKLKLNINKKLEQKTASVKVNHADYPVIANAEISRTSVIDKAVSYDAFNSHFNNLRGQLKVDLSRPATAIDTASSEDCGDNTEQRALKPSINKRSPRVAEKEASTMEGSIVRRNRMEDISKMMDGLTAVQESTDVMLNYFHKKLESKRTSQQQQQVQHHHPTTIDSKRSPTNSKRKTPVVDKPIKKYEVDADTTQVAPDSNKGNPISFTKRKPLVAISQSGKVDDKAKLNKQPVVAMTSKNYYKSSVENSDEDNEVHYYSMKANREKHNIDHKNTEKNNKNSVTNEKVERENSFNPFEHIIESTYSPPPQGLEERSKGSLDSSEADSNLESSLRLITPSPDPKAQQGSSDEQKVGKFTTTQQGSDPMLPHRLNDGVYTSPLTTGGTLESLKHKSWKNEPLRIGRAGKLLEDRDLPVMDEDPTISSTETSQSPVKSETINLFEMIQRIENDHEDNEDPVDCREDVTEKYAGQPRYGSMSEDESDDDEGDDESTVRRRRSSASTLLAEDREADSYDAQDDIHDNRTGGIASQNLSNARTSSGIIGEGFEDLVIEDIRVNFPHRKNSQQVKDSKFSSVAKMDLDNSKDFQQALQISTNAETSATANNDRNLPGSVAVDGVRKINNPILNESLHRNNPILVSSPIRNNSKPASTAATSTANYPKGSPRSKTDRNTALDKPVMKIKASSPAPTASTTTTKSSILNMTPRQRYKLAMERALEEEKNNSKSPLKQMKPSIRSQKGPKSPENPYREILESSTPVNSGVPVTKLELEDDL